MSNINYIIATKAAEQPKKWEESKLLRNKTSASQ